MEYIFFLQHNYEDDEYEIVTDIATYSSLEKAEEAVKKFRENPKFKDYPDGFNIDRYKIDESEWGEGFFTWDNE